MKFGPHLHGPDETTISWRQRCLDWTVEITVRRTAKADGQLVEVLSLTSRGPRLTRLAKQQIIEAVEQFDEVEYVMATCVAGPTGPLRKLEVIGYQDGAKPPAKAHLEAWIQPDGTAIVSPVVNR